MEGYQKVRMMLIEYMSWLSDTLQWAGDFFYVPSALGERLMIPVKYLEDLKTAPIDKVDFVATFAEVTRIYM